MEPFTKTQLLWELGLSGVDFSREAVQVIEEQAQREDLAVKSQEMSGAIADTEQGTAWMTSAKALLLVDGHCEDDCHGATSPLSVVCASLARHFAGSHPYVVLQYYCNHQGIVVPHGLPAGPLGLIKSLLAQLLHQSDDVLQENLWLNVEICNKAVLEDIGGLCQLFESLTYYINRSKITVCVIDEIAQFERAHDGLGWADGMRQVAHSLLCLTRAPQGPNLRVMMTCADQSIMVSRDLRRGEKISLG